MKKTITTILIGFTTIVVQAQGFYAFEENEKFGLKSKKGQVIIPSKYDFVVNEDAYKLVIASIANKWGIFDTTGKELTAIKYDDISMISGYEKSEVFKVKLDNKFGFVDRTGKEITPLKYDEVGYFGLLANPVFKVKFNNAWCFVDKTGKELTPPKYSYVDDEMEFRQAYTLIAVSENNKWGFVDWTGKEVIPCIYDKVYRFAKQTTEVTLGDRVFNIDKNGKEIKE